MDRLTIVAVSLKNLRTGYKHRINVTDFWTCVDTEAGASCQGHLKLIIARVTCLSKDCVSMQTVPSLLYSPCLLTINFLVTFYHADHRSSAQNHFILAASQLNSLHFVSINCVGFNTLSEVWQQLKAFPFPSFFILEVAS